jgi:hypothetical protein
MHCEGMRSLRLHWLFLHVHATFLNPGSYSILVLCFASFVLCVAILAVAIIFLLVEITANEGLERSLIDPEEEAEKHMLKLCKDWIDKQP